jgi:hypothetical protein
MRRKKFYLIDNVTFSCYIFNRPYLRVNILIRVNIGLNYGII